MSKFIYHLIDPITSEVCYIGQTHNVKRRYEQHCIAKQQRHQTFQSTVWLYSLLLSGRKPSIRVVMNVSPSDSNKAERQMIQDYWLRGFPLVNGGLDGGIRNRKRRLRWVDRMIKANWNQFRLMMIPSDSFYPSLVLHPLARLNLEHNRFAIPMMRT